MKTMYLAVAMASALALSTPATAGFFDFTLAPYVGASVGQAQANISCPAATTCDDKDTGWKAYGGLEVNEYLSMEVGYADFGKSTYSGAVSGTRRSRGATLQLVGTYAVNPSITLLGKGGFGILHTEVKGNIVAPYTSLADTDLEWTLGLGAQYNFTKAAGLRLEWERYFNVGSTPSNASAGATTGEADIDLITAGLVYKF
jgi:OOP family OmpA-OmpF porin